MVIRRGESRALRLRFMMGWKRIWEGRLSSLHILGVAGHLSGGGVYFVVSFFSGEILALLDTLRLLFSLSEGLWMGVGFTLVRYIAWTL